MEHFVLDSHETERLGTRTRWIPSNFIFFTGGAVVNDSGGAVVTPCPAPEHLNKFVISSPSPPLHDSLTLALSATKLTLEAKKSVREASARWSVEGVEQYRSAVSYIAYI